MTFLAATLAVALLVVGSIAAGRAVFFASSGITSYRYQSDAAGLALGLVLMILGAMLLMWTAV